MNNILKQNLSDDTLNRQANPMMIKNQNVYYQTADTQLLILDPEKAEVIFDPNTNIAYRYFQKKQ